MTAVELPPAVREYLESQIGEAIIDGRDPAVELLREYGPKPKWHPGDVVRLTDGSICTLHWKGDVRESNRWSCCRGPWGEARSIARWGWESDAHINRLDPVLLVRDGKAVQS